MVNDVFAHLRTGVRDDSPALVVELKSAWVLASSVPDPGDYITTTAAVPRYNKTATEWTLVPDVSDTVLLCMIGMHVVGSVNQHPEMIWATFVRLCAKPFGTARDATSEIDPETAAQLNSKVISSNWGIHRFLPVRIVLIVIKVLILTLLHPLDPR
ncbi:MAG TPA: hypothetical protein VNV35_21665 [Puia sp.]|jgi:hypothetical protein|nr:hypothetical protein [Puia sp.]